MKNCCCDCEEKSCSSCKIICWILAIIGIIAVIAGIAYAVYRFCAPDYLEDFDDEDFDDEDEDDEPVGVKVETADGVHTSGGYGAGMAQDPESRRFSEARQYIEKALQQTVN